MIMYIVLKSGRYIEFKDVCPEELTSITKQFSKRKNSWGVVKLLNCSANDNVFAAIRWRDISAIYSPSDKYTGKSCGLRKE